MRLTIEQALTKGSVFPQGPYDFAFWFAGDVRPIQADDDGPGRHLVDVPTGWVAERDGRTTYLRRGHGEGSALDAWDVLMAAMLGDDGFAYIPEWAATAPAGGQLS